MNFQRKCFYFARHSYLLKLNKACFFFKVIYLPSSLYEMLYPVAPMTDWKITSKLVAVSPLSSDLGPSVAAVKRKKKLL